MAVPVKLKDIIEGLEFQSAETELGLSMVALEPQSGLAELSEEQLQQVQTLESELGLTLLAYSRD